MTDEQTPEVAPDAPVITATIATPPPGCYYAKVPDASLIPDSGDLPANCAGVIVDPTGDCSTFVTTPAGEPDVIQLTGDAVFHPIDTAAPSSRQLSARAIAALLAAAEPPVYN